MEILMSRTRTRAAVAASVAAVALIVAVPAHAHPLPAKDDVNTAQAAIVGTWRMMIDPLPNPAGDPPAFPSVISFNSDGTVIDAVSSVPGYPALMAAGANGATSGLGSWSQKKDTVKFTFERFITKDGKFVARQRIQGTLKVAKSGFTQSGPAVATFLDGSDTPLGPSVQIAASGRRLTP
jgi:hypothetical protein